MELVLSPGFTGDNDGSPFHNEDIHEWSHVDRLTGMLENARIETGRWQARNEKAAQSYGKVIDSRERNSADGNVIQRAQRKVEVFQSQGAGGKSVQVIRASQWSSSRVSDFIHSSPLVKSPIDHHVSEFDSGIKSRLNNWGLSKDSLMLDPLSSLCQKIHSQVVNNTHSLPIFGQDSAPLTDQNLSKTFNIIDRNKVTNFFSNEKKSNSNEDLTSLIVKEDSLPSLNFTRDYKLRRSLQLSNRKNERDLNNSGVKLADLNQSELSDTKNPKVRLMKTAHSEQDNYKKDSYTSLGRNSTIQGSRSPSTVISSKTNLVNNPKPLTYFFKDPPEKNRESSVEIQKPTSIRLCTQEANQPVTSNKTVVHLGKPEGESTGHIKVTIDLKSTPENEVLRDLNSQESSVLFLTDNLGNQLVKPTKKVGFCKTEVHFVADSGKVNIVETDGKPPPTNRFRRRRRNNNSTSLGIPTNKNLPVIHFGDTSYEKYIFGASKKPDFEEAQSVTNVVQSKEEEDYKDAWQLSLKSNLMLENQSELKKDFSADKNTDQINSHDKIMDQRHKGHTTTVNFWANEFCNSRNVMRDSATKLGNLEEISLEAPKIISALNLMTRKNDHRVRKLNIKPRSTEAEYSEEVISGEKQILLKPVTVQKPVTGRVDFDHSPKLVNKFAKRPSTPSSMYLADNINEMEKVASVSIKPNKLEEISSYLITPNEIEPISPQLIKLNQGEKISPRLIKSNDVDKKCTESAMPVTHEAKDFCDVSSGVKERICDPNSFSHIYVNVFNSGGKDVPIYENFEAVKSISDGEIDSKMIQENKKSENKVKPSKLKPEEIPGKIKTTSKHKSSVSSKAGSTSGNKTETEYNKSPLIRKSKKDAVVIKEKKSEDLDKEKRVSNKTLMEKVVSRDRSINPLGDKLKNSKISSVRRDPKKTGSKLRNLKHSTDSGNETSVKVEVSNSTRTKKPVEVVYKTAVYNMKNEKLSKSTKAKESKGPRYINDIICGSKEKKSSTEKHAKTNTLPQVKNSKGSTLTIRK